MMYAKGIMLVSAWLLCSPLGSLGAAELQHAGETRLQSLRHKCSITQSCRKFVLSLGIKLPLFHSSYLVGFQLRSLKPCLQKPWGSIACHKSDIPAAWHLHGMSGRYTVCLPLQGVC